ncbi:hypothetical protein PEM37_39715 [Streptomyces sp. AD681]|uniref:hypothetical protein n=1 Tax=Streptomyces sp. AD681 TaxID=3019069 RepID=UPI0022F1CD46|nr:hypothetical protein [Streptomyces sp. AD681]MDA5147619.1 hypothetical protein [Streptomyces sp. AD681]
MRPRALLAAAVVAAATLTGAAETAAADGGLLDLPNDVIGSTAGALGQASDFSTNSGDVDVVGDTGGILNSHGAPVVNVDLRCAVPNPDVQYIGGTLFGGNRAACNTQPVALGLGDHRVL